MNISWRKTNLIILYPRYFLDKVFHNLMISLMEITPKEIVLYDIIKLFISFSTFCSNLISQTR